MLLRNLHARHCLADGSKELRCPQRKNCGTAVSCSPVIRVLLYYCMYVSLLYLMFLIFKMFCFDVPFRSS
jgi:hypothetical protein